jgi:hypothetical protein
MEVRREVCPPEKKLPLRVHEAREMWSSRGKKGLVERSSLTARQAADAYFYAKNS